MPATPHIEQHFTATETVRDIVIGMSDGLTVPFALAAGISGAGAATNIVVTAGLAEIAAGSIAMGLGGYLAARTDAEHYETERQREVDETEQVPDKEKEEVAEIFREYGLSETELNPMVNAFHKFRESTGSHPTDKSHAALETPEKNAHPDCIPNSHILYCDSAGNRYGQTVHCQADGDEDYHEEVNG